MTKTEMIIVLGVNGLISGVMLLIGIISYIRTKKFLSNAVETRGIVTASVDKGMSDGGGTMYSPQIRFTDSLGREFEFTENWSGNRPDFKIGEEVIVLYDPAKPNEARRGGKKWKFFFIAWLLGGMGILFSGILLIFVVIILLVPLL